MRKNIISQGVSRRGFLVDGCCAMLTATMRPLSASAAQSDPLPSYWSSHLPGIAEKINRNKARTSDAFFFLTDVHMHANKLYSGKAIAQLIGSTGVKNVYCGGDVPVAFGDKASASTTSLDGALAKYMDYVVDPVLAAGGRYYGAKGNHDFSINANYNGIKYGTGVSHTYSALWARDYIMASRPAPFVVTNADDPYACYYYRDAPHSRIRYIVIDTSDSTQAESNASWGVGYGMHQPQIDWLADHALATMPAGWSAVIMGHIPIAPIVGTEYSVSGYNLSVFRSILEAYQNRGTVTSFGITRDFSNAAGNILFCLSGHWHVDRFTNLNGILHVTQVCDAAYNDYKKGSPFCGNELNRNSGSVNEQAFDCWQCDPRTRNIYATRIGGCSQDRLFHTRAVQVPAGGTHRFATTRLKGSVTWACYDGDRGTISESYSTVEQNVVFNNDHLVSIGDNGKLTAGTPGSGVVVAYDSAYNKEVFCVEVV